MTIGKLRVNLGFCYFLIIMINLLLSTLFLSTLSKKVVEIPQQILFDQFLYELKNNGVLGTEKVDLILLNGYRGIKAKQRIPV